MTRPSQTQPRPYSQADLPGWYRQANGPSAKERRIRRRHGKALEKGLATKAQAQTLKYGRPYKYADGRDYHSNPIKRFLLRCIATIRELAR